MRISRSAGAVSRTFSTPSRPIKAVILLVLTPKNKMYKYNNIIYVLVYIRSRVRSMYIQCVCVVRVRNGGSRRFADDTLRRSVARSRFLRRRKRHVITLLLHSAMTNIPKYPLRSSRNRFVWLKYVIILYTSARVARVETLKSTISCNIIRAYIIMEFNYFFMYLNRSRE